MTKAGLVHHALFYGSDYEYVIGIENFLEGDGYDGPALVAVPTANLELLRDYFDGDSPNVRFTDMARLGGNPGRIIPAVRGFVEEHAGESVRFVGEPVWAGRSLAEIDEATRHEALLNLAFADSGAKILCPYDTKRLDPDVLADAAHTHPEIVTRERRAASPDFADPVEFRDAERWPLLARPAATARLDFADLATPRLLVRRHSQTAGLDDDRAAALLLAANEICTNTLQHGGGRGTLRIWQTATHLVCEVHDTGTISDPLAGSRRPHEEAGRGLYAAHHLCDLVQIRSTSSGTTVRLHAARRP